MYLKMQIERSSLCGLPHNVKLIIFRLPLDHIYKSGRGTSPPNLKSKFDFGGTK